jgi:hypothetical protein
MSFKLCCDDLRLFGFSEENRKNLRLTRSQWFEEGRQSLRPKLIEARFAARVASKAMSQRGTLNTRIWHEHVLPFLGVFRKFAQHELMGPLSSLAHPNVRSIPETSLSPATACESRTRDLPAGHSQQELQATSTSTSPCSVSIPFTPVIHLEQAAVISESEAANIVSVQESDFIQRSAAAADFQTEPEHGQSVTENVYLLHLKRTPSQVVHALTEGVPLRNCREALTKAGYNWKLISGAMVFVEPWQYRPVMLALNGYELKTSHVIVASSMEYLVAESMQDIGQGACAKSRVQLPLIQTSSSCDLTHSSSDAEDDESQEAEEQIGLLAELIVKRTFVSAVPLLQDASLVTQSTTEASSNHVRNPRRRFLEGSHL